MPGESERWAAFLRQIGEDRRFIIGFGVDKNGVNTDTVELFIKSASPTQDELAEMLRDMLGDGASIEIPTTLSRTVRVRRRPFTDPLKKDI